MADLKENLAFLSAITGMECQEGDFDQITRVASNLYVDGHNYMTGKDWTKLDEQKLNQLCMDMREAVSATSTKNVACIKWNDPWAPVFPVYPYEASKERREQIDEFWKTYEEKRLKNGIKMISRGDNKIKEKTDPSAEQLFWITDRDFWEKGDHAYSNFRGGVREKAGFVRLLLFAQGLTEEEVLDPSKQTDKKKATVQRLKEVIDKKSKLSKEEREQKMEQMLGEAKQAIYQRKLKPLDLNDIDSLEIFADNRVILDEWYALFQIVQANKESSPVCKKMEQQLSNNQNLIGSLMLAEGKRANMVSIVYQEDEEEINRASVTDIPKADSMDIDEITEGLKLQGEIDCRGLGWNEYYKGLIKNGNTGKDKQDEKMFGIENITDPDDQEQLKESVDKYWEAETREEKQNIRNQQVQIVSKYTMNPMEQEKLKSVTKPLKNPLEKLLDKLRKADPSYLVSSDEFKRLKKSLEEAVQAEPEAVAQKMQEVYENANEYILKKAAKPATGHGKERLDVAREIRNTIGDMLVEKDSYYQMAEMFDFIRAPRQAEEGRAKIHQENIIKFTREKLFGKENPKISPLSISEKYKVLTAFMSAEEYYDQRKNSSTDIGKTKERALKFAKKRAEFLNQKMSGTVKEFAENLYSESLKLYKDDNNKDPQKITAKSLKALLVCMQSKDAIMNKHGSILDDKAKRAQILKDCRKMAEKITSKTVKEYSSKHIEKKAPVQKKKPAGPSL